MKRVQATRSMGRALGGLLLLLCLLTVRAEAADIVASGTCGPSASWTLDDDGVLTVSGSGSISSVDDNTQQPWYSWQESIRSIVIQEGITAIGNNTFSYLFAEGTLQLPDSLTTIGYGAFFNDGALTGSLVIPDGVTTIGASAFGRCGGFTGDLVIPDSVKTIGDSAFFNCSGFTGDLTIGNGVTTIGSQAFHGCSGFTGTLTLGSSVTKIGDSAFYFLNFTGNLVIPDSVKTIGYQAFRESRTYSGKLVLGKGVTSIGKYAFYYCTGFTGDLVIPDSVKTIGDYAFSNCTGFNGDLTIGNGVTLIDSAFKGSTGFKGTLTLGNSVTEIGSSAFSGCSGFTGDLVIPDSVKTIYQFAFQNCSGFTGTLTLGSGLTSIGNNAFYGCSGFTGELVIPDSIKTISDRIFYDCSGFSGKLVIPTSVTSIGSDAFYGCSGFTGELDLPNSLTTLGLRAFKNCSGITSVTIPGSVSAIAMSSFYGCTSLQSVCLRNGITSIEGQAFYNTGLRTVVLPPSTTELGNGAFGNCLSLESIAIPLATVSIDQYALTGCKNLQSIYYGGTQSDRAAMTSWFSNNFGSTSSAVVYYESYFYSSVEIQNGDDFTVNAEEELTLTAICSTVEEPADIAADIVWSVGSTEALTISSHEYRISGGRICLTATFTGAAAGDATVTVTTPDGASDSVTVHVKDDKTVVIQDRPGKNEDGEEEPLRLKKGETAVITAKYTTCRSAADEVSQIHWQAVNAEDSDAEPVLTVKSATCRLGSDGHTATLTATVEALGYGAATLTVTGPDEAKDSIEVLVPVTIIHILPKEDAKVPKKDETAALAAVAGETLRICAAYETAGDIAEELEELAWTVSPTDVLKQTGDTTWTTRSDGTVIVSAEFLVRTVAECTVTLQRGDLAKDSCVVQSFFNVPRYRTDKFHDTESSTGMRQSLTSFLALETPCEIFVTELQKNGFDTAAATWKAMDAILEFEPSQMKDLVVDLSDIYAAIILDMLEAASETSLNNTGLTAAEDLADFMEDTADLVGAVDKYDALSKEQQEKIVEILDQALRYGFDGDTMDKISADAEFVSRLCLSSEVYLKCGTTVLGSVDAYLNAIQIARLTDSMKAVLKEMNLVCSSDNIYLKKALRKCITIIESSGEELMASVISGDLLAVGIDGAFECLDTLFNEYMDLYLSANFPGIKIVRDVGRGTKCVTNVLFGVDGTVEQYFNMVAMAQVEEVAEATLWNLLTKDDNTDTAADSFLTALDLIFVLRDQDCLKANDFVRAQEESVVGLLQTALGKGDQSVTETLEQFRRDYASWRVNSRTGWISYLSGDYPDTLLEDYYDKEFWANYAWLVNTSFTIACPVDVYVRDASGTLVASVVDGVPTSNSKYVSVMTDGERKWVHVTDDQSYTVTCQGSGSGTMDVTVTEHSTDGGATRTVYYYDVPVSTATTHTLKVDTMTATDGSTVTADLDSSRTEGLATYTLTASCAALVGPDGIAFSGTYCPNSTVRVSAYIPAGLVFLGWSSSAGSGIFDDPASPVTTLRMPAADVEIYPLFQAAPADSNAALTAATQDGQLRVTVTNATDYLLTGQLWAAVYDAEGRLLTVTSRPVTAAANAAGEAVLPWAPANGETMKLLLLDGDTLLPMAAALPVS